MTEERKFQSFSCKSNLINNTDANLNTLGQVLVSTTKPVANVTSTSGIQTNSFPAKLHRMLTDIENGDDGLDQYIGWTSHGRAFVIRDREKFISEVMPRYFYHFKFNSFTRQLNLFGFRRISKEGSFYHMHFLRGRPELANKIQRIKGGKGGKKTKDPDFDALQLSIKEGATPTTDRNKPAEAEKEAETDAATSSNLAPAESSQSKAESSKWFSDTPNHIKSEVNLDFDDAKELLAPIVNSTDASTYYLQQHLDWSDVNDHDLSPQAEHDKPCSALFYQHAASHRTSSLAGMPRGLSFMQETIGNPEPCFSSFVDCHQDIDQHQQAGNIFQQQQNQMQHVPTQAIDTISLGQAFPTQQHPFQYSAQTSDGGQGVDLASLYRQQQILELQIQGLKQQEQFLRLRSEQQL